LEKTVDFPTLKKDLLMTKTLVTSALPYANGDIHIGHLVEYIQTDIYVRFLKSIGEDAIYICASDTHGTPIEINARKLGITPEEMVAGYNKAHLEDFENFQIKFDEFYTTDSPETKENVELIFNNLKKQGLIYEKDVEQYYCEHDKRFLPDRFVRGKCPKCKAEEQYGDSCEKCGTTYDPTDILDAHCSMCGKPPVRKSSNHYFVELEKARSVIEDWVYKEGNVHPEISRWLKKNFLESGLRPWDISRESPYFGFLIPGETDKYFYVWMDAPVGYIGATKRYCDKNGLDFDSYWKSDADCKLIHVLGKDITYFHTLFWPAMLHYGGFNMPDRVQIHGFLTVNGEKMSKSRGTSIKAKTFLKHLDPQYLRFYYASKLGSGIDDLNLNIEEFRLRVNAELVNKIANLASRSCSLLSKRLEGQTGGFDPDFQEILEKSLVAKEKIASWFKEFEFAKAMREIEVLAEAGNKYLQDSEPFRLVKSEPEKARAILSSVLGLVKGITIMLGPVLPEMKIKIERILNDGAEWNWNDNDFIIGDRVINKFERLVERVEESDVLAMVEETKETTPEESTDEKIEPFKELIDFDDFSKLDLRIGTVVEAELVKKAKKLLRLTVDLGSETRNVLAGIRSDFTPEFLLGKKVMVVANLKPRKMKFGVSEAMVLAAENSSGDLALLTPMRDGDTDVMTPGTVIS
jgi:methionyl-tRNA synthetase